MKFSYFLGGKFFQEGNMLQDLNLHQYCITFIKWNYIKWNNILQ